MKTQHVAPNAAKVLQHMGVVRNDVETAVALLALLRAGSEDSTVEAINGLPSAIVRSAALVQNAILMAAFAAISRAHDKSPDAASLPNIFRLLPHAAVRDAVTQGPDAAVHLAEAEREWQRLESVAGYGALEYALRTGRGAGNLLTVMKAVRDSQLAHTIPAKADGGPNLYSQDLFGLVHHSAQIFDHLCRALGIADQPTEAAASDWLKRGVAFWRHVARETQSPPGSPSMPRS